MKKLLVDFLEGVVAGVIASLLVYVLTGHIDLARTAGVIVMTLILWQN